MKPLNKIIRFICSLAISSAITLLIVFVLFISPAFGSPATDNLLKKLLDSLLSGEVIGLFLAGFLGFLINRVRSEYQRRQEEADELHRLRFKEESIESAREVVRESSEAIKSLLLPKLNVISDDLDEIRIRLDRVEVKTDTALRKSELLEKTQAAWLRRAEEKISVILSSESGHPTLIKNLFYDDTNETDD